MRKKAQIVCARCGLQFLSDSGNRKWCDNCLATVHREQQWEKYKRRAARKRGETVAPTGAPTGAASKPVPTISEVIAYCKEYERRTGRWLDYGDAVMMMESEGK